MQKSFLIQCDHRFANNELEQDRFIQMEELPLSEGFHWESLPDGPSLAPSTGLPPPLQETELATKPQSRPLMPEASKELPEHEDNRGQTLAMKSAKSRKNTVVTVSEQQCSIDRYILLIPALC